MDSGASGRLLAERVITVEVERVRDFTLMLGTESAPASAALFLYFGPLMAGGELRTALNPDLRRSELARQQCWWARPLLAGEELQVAVHLVSVREDGGNRVAVVETTFRDGGGGEAHRQRSTFVQFASPSLGGHAFPVSVPGEAGQSSEGVGATGKESFEESTSPITRVQLARWSCLMGDFNPFHLDDDFARAEGLPAPTAHPPLVLALALDRLVARFGADALKETDFRLRRLPFPGERLQVVAEPEREAGLLRVLVYRAPGEECASGLVRLRAGA